MSEYKRNNGDDKIRRLVESQKQAIAKRIKLIDAYMAQLENFVEEGSNLFNGFFNGILKLLPTIWANFINRFLLVVGIIVEVPIVFLLLIITCKCFSLLWWCYAPALSRIAGSARSARSVGVCRAVGNLFHRIRTSVQTHYNVVGRNERIRQENIELRPRRHRSRTAKAASQIL